MKKTARWISLLVLLPVGFLAGAWYSQRSGTTPSYTNKILYYVDPMHPAYRSDKPGIAPDCGMELTPVYADGAGPASGGGDTHTGLSPAGAVQISAEKQQLIGVTVSEVQRTEGKRTLRLFGRVTPDETRVYQVIAGTSGYIREAYGATTGSQVRKGQVLATFSAPDVVGAFQAYIVALNTMDRLRRDGAERAAQSTANSSNYQQREVLLQNLGVSRMQMDEVARTRQVPEEVKIVTPAAGFVLARNVSSGQRFERGAEWFRIADLQRIWILADVHARDAHYLRPGVRAKVSMPNQGVTLWAKVSEVLPQFDAATRRLKVRLEADNPGLVLRPDMFVDVELPIAVAPTIAVPADAVLDSGRRKTVFVDRGQGSFEPRTVETGWHFGDEIEIVAGLSPGERIAISGTFLIDSESKLRSSAGTHNTVIRDPVCGMRLEEAKATAAGNTAQFRGATYWFCSAKCKHDFEESPAQYVNEPDRESQHNAHEKRVSGGAQGRQP